MVSASFFTGMAKQTIMSLAWTEILFEGEGRIPWGHLSLKEVRGESCDHNWEKQKQQDGAVRKAEMRFTHKVSLAKP